MQQDIQWRKYSTALVFLSWKWLDLWKSLAAWNKLYTIEDSLIFRVLCVCTYGFFWSAKITLLRWHCVLSFTGAAPSHGVVGSSAHLLSSSACSSPTFHLASGPGPVCDYSACSRTSHPLHRYAPPLSAESYSRLASPGADAFSTTRGSTYGPESEAFSCAQSGLPIQIHSMPSTTSQLQYLMPSHTHNAFSTNQSTQGSYNGFRLHSPYGLYGYNFSTSPRLATSPEKAAATQSSFLGSSPSGTLTDRQLLSTVDGLHMLSSSQQNLFDSRTLGLTSSASQVTAHMAWTVNHEEQNLSDGLYRQVMRTFSLMS